MHTVVLHSLYVTQSDGARIDGAPSERHFAVCRARVPAAELDPAEDTYVAVDAHEWRRALDDDGRVAAAGRIRRVS